jgi:hypothetical protein
MTAGAVGWGSAAPGAAAGAGAQLATTATSVSSMNIFHHNCFTTLSFFFWFLLLFLVCRFLLVGQLQPSSYPKGAKDKMMQGLPLGTINGS